ncbi:DUF6629 family protein [Kitasatospora sp. NPDC058170]|uniref:DUF6629 family protein n=1 Tax=Kitasatospora sp. NPDC058170 TaxID=3346364 RepID=UPI0036DAEDD0
MCWSAQADLIAGGLVSGVGVLCLVRAHRAGHPERLPLAALPLVLGLHQLIEAAVWFGADGGLSPGPAGWARTAWAVIALPLLPLLVPVGVWCAAGPAEDDPAITGRPALDERSTVTEPSAVTGRPVGAGRPVVAGPPVVAGGSTAAGLSAVGDRPAAGPRHAAAGRRRRAVLAGFALLGVLVAVPLATAVATHPVTAQEHGRTLSYAIGIPHPGLLLTGYLLATVGSLLVSGDRLLRRLGVLIGVGAAVCAVLWQMAFVSTWCALAAVVSVVLLHWAGRRSD